MILYGAKDGSAIAWNEGVIWTDGITAKAAEALIARPVVEMTAAEDGGTRYAKRGELAYVRAALQKAGYLVVELEPKAETNPKSD